jgi:hypothetical protein
MVTGSWKSLVASGIAMGVLTVCGCQNGAQTGAVVGALAGAGLGQVAGQSSEATVLGAAIGGAAGYALGNEQDKADARAERARIRSEMDYVTVNVRNSNGSISRVRLRREGIGYVGTRGEFYDHLPTEDELRPVYGF